MFTTTDHCYAHYLGMNWSGWKVLINSPILTNGKHPKKSKKRSGEAKCERGLDYQPMFRKMRSHSGDSGGNQGQMGELLTQKEKLEFKCSYSFLLCFASVGQYFMSGNH